MYRKSMHSKVMVIHMYFWCWLFSKEVDVMMRAVVSIQKVIFSQDLTIFTNDIEEAVHFIEACIISNIAGLRYGGNAFS